MHENRIMPAQERFNETIKQQKLDLAPHIEQSTLFQRRVNLGEVLESAILKDSVDETLQQSTG